MNRPNFVVLVSLLLVCATFAFLPPDAVSFSPKTWFHRDLQRLEALSLQFSQRRPKPLAFSDGKGLVAGANSALAVHAGVEALKKGGNAMDACLTTAMTGTYTLLCSSKHFSKVTQLKPIPVKSFLFRFLLRFCRGFRPSNCQSVSAKRFRDF